MYLPSEALETLDPGVILDRASALVPRLRERAEETERLRRLPESTIKDAAGAGIFSLLLPRSLGGAGGDLRAFVTLIRTLAQGDLSAAWTLGFFTVHGWLMARYPAEVQQELFRGGAQALMAMSANPPGKALPVAGGYEVTGYWGYCSGVMHADWVVVTAIIQGRDQVTLFLLPRADVDVKDTWYMAGMQGTGSNDVQLDGQFVPAHRSVDFDHLFGRNNPGAVLHPEPLYTYDARNLLTFLFPSMAVGAAEAVLDDYRNRLERRRAAFSKNLTGDTVPGQIRYARSVSALRLAQASLERILELTIQANASSSATISDELLALIKLDCVSICQMAWKSVQTGLAGSGSSVFKTTDRTQQVLRDLQVLLSHLTIDEDGMQAKAGEILLGRAAEADPARNFT
jgi:alkylation response protein AidB-like acyl-CoA dehydrogenase